MGDNSPEADAIAAGFNTAYNLHKNFYDDVLHSVVVGVLGIMLIVPVFLKLL